MVSLRGFAHEGLSIFGWRQKGLVASFSDKEPQLLFPVPELFNKRFLGGEDADVWLAMTDARPVFQRQALKRGLQVEFLDTFSGVMNHDDEKGMVVPLL